MGGKTESTELQEKFDAVLKLATDETPDKQQLMDYFTSAAGIVGELMDDVALDGHDRAMAIIDALIGTVAANRHLVLKYHAE